MEKGNNKHQIMLQPKSVSDIKYVNLSLYVLCENLILPAFTLHIELFYAI